MNKFFDMLLIFHQVRDGQLKRIGDSAENFNFISKITLGLIDNDKSVKNSEPNKRLMAVMIDTEKNYLIVKSEILGLVDYKY